MSDSSEVKEVVEAWIIQRTKLFEEPGMKYNDGSNAASMRRFIEIHNAQTRRLITAVQVSDPQFWDALVELASNAGRIVGGGRLFLNGEDRTSEGM